ncbi:two-component sensor histidine kinase BarA [Alkalimonas collagenimarina]|uniref:histidine kinase n=1 Tax=Alkalimonas collagenimarina TaxID=400390 RepID=A0ABT9GWJ5_9GAMM|nr:two-component sensor histidine kinase BarA [Alkalimonas collagenimarina]MDP4535421.1 two-component sensor histidine kinase BarA [Alkalimonas collagenimarina]
MTTIALQHRILLLTIAPALAISILLGWYFSQARTQDVQSYLEQQASNIAEPLALASQQAMADQNYPLVNRLLDLSHRKNSPLVKSIAVFTPDHRLITTSNHHPTIELLQHQTPTSAMQHTELQRLRDWLIIRTPIWQESAATDNSELLGYLSVQLQRDSIKMARQSSWLSSAGAVLIALLFSAIAGWLASRYISRPIEAMLSLLQQHKHLLPDDTAALKNPNELQRLQQGLQALLHYCQGLQDEMQQQVEQVTADLEQSMEQLEVQSIELELGRRKAIEENRQKTEFLAKMSHELRTPLNGVLGFTRQLLKTQLSASQFDYLQTIQKSANSLLTLVNDVLDFARLEEGRMPLNPQPMSLRELLDDALELLAAQAFEKQLELALIIDPSCPDDVVVDTTRLTQILMNIAGNAIKFTERGSVVIRVRASILSQQQLSLHFSVQDTGIGLSEAQQQGLFHGSSHGQSSDGHNIGAGLGLMISQKLVHAMAGTIGVDSQPDQGANFWFTLECKRHPSTVSEPLPLTVLDGKSVLFFEPQQYSREASLNLLHSWGLNVTPCATQAQLQQALARDQSYDMALLGRTLSLHQLNQIQELVQRVKPHVGKCYLLVNTLSPHMREAIQLSGADACLSKPVHHRKLAMVLAQPYLQSDQTSAQELVSPKANLRVLVVDDNDANLKLIHTLLAELVTSVDSAVNGAEAWHKTTQHLYDMIFMDINMPVMDGVAACKKIQLSSLNEQTPIIAVTAHAVEGERERLLKLGFADFLSKPLDEHMLQLTLQEHQQHSVSNQDQSSTPIVPISSYIDWSLSLQRAGGKAGLALDMLHMLCTSLPESYHLIQQAWQQQDAETLLQHVHKLHGATCYSGVPQLKQLTEQLETQLKKGEPLSQLEPEMLELSDVVEGLLLDVADVDWHTVLASAN